MLHTQKSKWHSSCFSEKSGDGATGGKGVSVHSLQPSLDGVFHASRHRSRFAEHPESVGHCSRPACRLCPHQGWHGCQTGDDMIQMRIITCYYITSGQDRLCGVENLLETWTRHELTGVYWCRDCWQKQRWTLTCRPTGQGIPVQTFNSVSVNLADILTPCPSLLFQAHGLPCPPALDTWKSTIEQRAVDMMCHLYKPNKRFRQCTELILFQI